MRILPNLYRREGSEYLQENINYGYHLDMATPEIPNSKIETVEDANKLLETVQELNDYVDDIEPGKILASATEDTLLKTLGRVPSVFTVLDDAVFKFSMDSTTLNLITSIMELLHSVVSDIICVLEENDKMKGN
ncbi:hypothetical protein F5Y05DRAFT_414907 [Hypoxylon sp. FL0543]|nr:hypothetical protein F5Y05DRAFT_414907 [Hypoxylon sp. FL0543]